MSESAESIPALLTRHALVAIDSNVLIYLIAGDPTRAEVAAAIVDAVATGRTGGVLSSAGLSGGKFLYAVRVLNDVKVDPSVKTLFWSI